MKTTKFIILVYSFFLVILCPQTLSAQKVRGEKPPTKEEIARQKLVSQANEYNSNFHKELAKLNLNTIYTSGVYTNTNDVTVLKREITKFENALYKISKSNASLYAQKADALFIRVGKKAKSKAYLDDKIKNINVALNRVKTRLREINKQQKKKQAKIDFLSQDTKNLKAQTQKLNKKNNVKSDFLSKKNNSKSTNDFLSKSNSSNNDFLSSRSNNGEIKYKEGMEGVVDKKTGKILIPFKKWRIAKYKSGIAKVNITVDSYSRDCSGTFGKYAAVAFKTGYVDKTGKFIDDFKITFDGGWTSGIPIRLVRGNDNRSYEEKQAAKRRAKQREALAKQKCKADYLNWQEKTMNQYN